MQLRNFVQSREIRASQALKVLTLSGHVINGYLLDLGCGQGLLTKKFSDANAFVVGIDKSEHLIRQAKHVVHGCEFIVSDGLYLPFRDLVFNTVIVNDVLEHVPYQDGTQLMKEAIRVLARDGKIYLSVMNRWQIFEPHLRVPFMTWMPKQTWDILYKLKIGKNVRVKYTRRYFPYTKAMFRKLAEQLRLRCEDFTWFYAAEKISDPQQIGSPMLKFLVGLFKKLGLGGFLLVAAKKVSVLIFVCRPSKEPC